MDPSLRQATLGAQNIQSPASPLGASSGPELAALYQSSFQLPQATAAAGAAGNIAQEQVAEAKRQAAAAEAAAKKRESDMSNINKYRIVQKKDGGYDFFDPDGNQVDIATLSKRTGSNAKDLIKGSKNPIDQGFASDYNRLDTFMQAVHDASGGNKKAVQKVTNMIRGDKGLQAVVGPDGTKQGGLDSLIKYFTDHYQRYYVTRDENPQAWGVNPGGEIFGNPGVRYTPSLTTKNGQSGGFRR